MLALSCSILLASALVLAAPPTGLESQRQPASPSRARYLVALNPDSDVEGLKNHLKLVKRVSVRDLGATKYPEIDTVYSSLSSFQGYAGYFDDATIAEIRNRPEVIAVEEDAKWSVDLSRRQPGPTMVSRGNRETAVLSTRLATQRNSTWGLATISHRHPGSTDYIYDARAGQGTWAYILDSGILATHSEFEDRAEAVFTAFGDNFTDSVGHGTHVAGTLGGKTFGVAKKCRLLGVKVLRGDGGNTSDIVKGFDWAVNDIISKNRTTSAVINISLGGMYSSVFNHAIERAAKSGIISIVASGNEGIDASDVSPASAPGAITVGAVDRDWKQAVYSNYGKAVDILGPGTDTISAGIRSNHDTLKDTGTSMAAPHIAGLALTAMSVEGIAGVAEVTEYLKKTATKGRIPGDLKGSPNLLGNNNVSDGAGRG